MAISFPTYASMLLVVGLLALPSSAGAAIAGGCIAVDLEDEGQIGTVSYTSMTNAFGFSAGAGAAGQGATVSVLVAPFSCVDAPSLPQAISPLSDLQTHTSDTRLPALP